MSVPTEIARIKGLRNDIRSRLIQIGALGDPNADLEACRDAMANVSTLTLSSIAITTPPDKVTYSPGESFDTTGMIVTATFAFGDSTITFDVSDYTYPTEGLEYGTTEVTISYTFLSITKTATQEIGVFEIDDDFDSNSWETISWVAQHGLGSTYWNIGDRKAITLSGPIGNYLSITNPITLYVYILDFNHPENGAPDNNIILGGFFTAKTGGKDVCLVDSRYGDSTRSPNFIRTFNYIHADGYQINEGSTSYHMSQPVNYGGWKGSDVRYDILGATEAMPSEYGSSTRPTDARTGYDATQAAIRNPVSKTILSAIPSSFRNVLRLRTHYMDNKGGLQSYDGSGRYVTAVTDAVSLLSEFEIFGSCSYSSPDEQNKQTQMAYYTNGGSTIKYRHDDLNTAAKWLTASVRFNDYQKICIVSNTTQNSVAEASNYSYGIAPVFKV